MSNNTVNTTDHQMHANDEHMKVRIGIGIAEWPLPSLTPNSVLELIDRCEALDIDSIWVSDTLVTDENILEPITFMAFMASRMKNMMFGTSVLVISTRNPVILAKELATLDLLSGGRLLPAVGLGPAESRDFAATGIRKEDKGKRADEAIQLMRRLWTADHVTFTGEFYSVEDVTITPKPYQKGGPPIWIGGLSDAALRRVGRLGDGWLVSTITPDEVARGIESIRHYATEAGREVPEDHYGVYLQYRFADDPGEGLKAALPYLFSRRKLPFPEFTAIGPPDFIRSRVKEYMDAGATKFVMSPACSGDVWYQQVELLAQEVIAPLQTRFSIEERQKRATISG